MNTIAVRMLDEFYNNGLYTMKKTADGKYEIVKTKITKEQYDYMKDIYLNKANNLGYDKT